MKSKLVLITAIISLVLTVHGIANANVIFSDNFNIEAYGLNYTGFANWDVTGGGTVDLIGAGTPFDYYPGNGMYVDLDGSTNNAGTLITKTNFSLNPGVYELQFALGGNHNSGSDTVDVNLGSLYSENFTLLSSDPLATITRNITVTSPTSGQLSFHNLGGDNVGAILDNVKLSAIPEPASLSLLGLGLLGLLHKRKK